MDNTSSMYLYVKLNWDANRFLPVEGKDCINSASYEYRNMSARRGTVIFRVKINWNCNFVSLLHHSFWLYLFWHI